MKEETRLELLKVAVEIADKQTSLRTDLLYKVARASKSASEGAAEREANTLQLIDYIYHHLVELLDSVAK